jgi:hypothetical protein
MIYFSSEMTGDKMPTALINEGWLLLFTDCFAVSAPRVKSAA